MIGKLNPEKKEALIVGAGISGLLIGYRLKQLGYKIEIHEASSRVGGLIQTYFTDEGMVETAAHSLLVNESVKKLADELDLKLTEAHTDSRARFVYRDGKMRKIPLHFFEIIQTIFQLFKKPSRELNPETASLEDWGEIYIGKAATQYLLAPFVTGVFACQPSDLNAKASFPQLIPNSPQLSLFQFLKKTRKPGQQRPKMMVFEFGTQSLVNKLSEKLSHEIRLNSPIHTLPSSPNLILTVPASVTASLIQAEDPKSSSLLQKVQYSPLITATVFFLKDSFKRTVPRGIGVLIPRNQGLRILGCLFNSSAFPGRVKNLDQVSLTVILGGTTDPQILQSDDNEIKTLIRNELDLLLGANRAPVEIELKKWPAAIPIYSNQLLEAQKSLAEGYCIRPGRIIFSNFSQGVSLRSIIAAAHQL